MFRIQFKTHLIGFRVSYLIFMFQAFGGNTKSIRITGNVGGGTFSGF
jgi:hypothetical protein